MQISVEQAIQIISDSTEKSRLATAATVLLDHYLDLLIVAQSMMEMVDEVEDE